MNPIFSIAFLVFNFHIHVEAWKFHFNVPKSPKGYTERSLKERAILLSIICPFIVEVPRCQSLEIDYSSALGSFGAILESNNSTSTPSASPTTIEEYMRSKKIRQPDPLTHGF